MSENKNPMPFNLNASTKIEDIYKNSILQDVDTF